jgi:hypothetical protein
VGEQNFVRAAERIRCLKVGNEFENEGDRTKKVTPVQCNRTDGSIALHRGRELKSSDPNRAGRGTQ